MYRITINDVRRRVALMNERTTNRYDFQIDNNGAHYRLTRDNKSVDLSPLMKASQLYTWLEAFIFGMELVKSDYEQLQKEFNELSKIHKNTKNEKFGD
jgi:hypothetical protein